jgi:hypothetical protein
MATIGNSTSVYTLEAIQNLRLISCYKCAIVWGQPVQFDNKRKADQESFFCPNGHEQYYAESETDDLKRQLDRARTDLAAARKRESGALASLRATKGHLTRLQKRAQAGVCIHCNRHFDNVARHMEGKHGEARND